MYIWKGRSGHSTNPGARAKERIHEIAEGVCAAYDVTADIKITDGYPCVVNNLDLVNEARKLFIDLWGRKNVFELDRRMTTEDFGFYTQQYPGLFYRLGVSSADGPTCSGLHTSTFNPDENALLYGVTTMATLAFASLEK